MKQRYRFGYWCCLILMAVFFSLGRLAATETRATSMGNTGLFFHDNSNIFIFPGSLLLYGNQIIGEFRVKGDSSTFSGGVHFPFGDYAVGGLWLNRNLNLPVPQGLLTGIALNETNDFVLGFKTGQYDLGFRISANAKSNKGTIGDTLVQSVDESARYFEFAAGISSRFHDFGGYVSLPKVESKQTLSGDRKWEGAGFGLSGRFFFGPEDGIMYVPAGLVDYLAADLTQGQQKVETDYLRVRLGMGVHYQINKTNLVVLGIEAYGLEESKEKVANLGEQTERVTNLPGFYLGGETHAKEWLILRVGATHLWREQKSIFKPTTGTETETSSRDSQFNLYLGTGFKIGRFLIDLDFNTDFFFEGPDFVSGHNAGQLDDFINRLSVTYGF